ncbi:MAG: hypothetical protein RLZZ108_601, partial [Actinomycetota bacterium]
MVNLFWFHRDLRTADHPALVAAGTEVAPVVLQSALDGLEGERRNSLVASWHSLNESLDGQLTVVTDLVRAAKDLGVEAVFTSRRFDPAGIAEQQAAEQALTAHGIRLVVGPGNYAVSPGQVAKPDGTPYRVYTPFFKAWFAIGWSKPVPRLAGVNWQSAGGSALPEYRA